jgi:hypothetical protein
MIEKDHPTPNDPAATEPAEPRQRDRSRAEHDANQRKQSSGDVDAAEPIDEELWVRATVEKYFGGEKPLHTSTLYRGVESGIYPPPINVSANSVRWVPAECRAARQRMLAARDKPKPPSRRGRKRGANAAKAKTAASAAEAAE